jgi:hypothetical protein
MLKIIEDELKKRFSSVQKLLECEYRGSGIYMCKVKFQSGANKDLEVNLNKKMVIFLDGRVCNTAYFDIEEKKRVKCCVCKKRIDLESEGTRVGPNVFCSEECFLVHMSPYQEKSMRKMKVYENLRKELNGSDAKEWWNGLEQVTLF